MLGIGVRGLEKVGVGFEFGSMVVIGIRVGIH